MTTAWPTPTGRLVAQQREGVDVLAIEVAAAWRLPALRAAIDHGRSFLARPMVVGLAPLVEADVDDGRLVYATGPATLLGALLDDARRRRRPLGPRAAAELGWLAAVTLVDAAATGPLQGVFCHGDVSPWRLAVRPGGGLTVLGYGVPDLQALRARAAGEVPVLPYAPPERHQAALEDVRSDLTSLARVLIEVATGEVPSTSGVPRARVPSALADVLTGLLATRPEARTAPEAAVTALAELVRAGLPGRSLSEIEAASRAPVDAPLVAPATHTVDRPTPPSAPTLDVPLRPRRAAPSPPSEGDADAPVRPRRLSDPPSEP